MAHFGTAQNLFEQNKPKVIAYLPTAIHRTEAE